ncbi:MAG TPA: cytochrome ubiquinol oxidase subunit I [Candidatus Kapabacteria bacterium]|nr:cytochrome ubiquinol oxidase subunit I [Candidatus Kapabacteria bacterium]
MNDFFFARSQMAVSLAFHIVFAAIGMGMPLLMAIAEWRYLRTGDAGYLDLAKRWAKGTAVFFAVGAVSGTVLSFELGLLWPGFMKYAGAIIGMPFSLEGFAFFTEAIFLGIYLYGWKRISPRMHWLAGVIVAASGIFSGIFVVTANAWMNAPAGFRVVNGAPVDIDPVAAMLNPASLHEVLHMTLAAYVATAFAVASVHAFFLLRDRGSLFHRRAFTISLAVGCIAIPLQLASGDLSARVVASLQPAKFAAMEGHYHTGPNAPVVIGGFADDSTRTVRYGLEIPGFLSFLAHDDFNATVTGLDAYPRDQWPNALLVHLSFDAMVGCGSLLFLLAAAAAWKRWRKRPVADGRRFLLAAVAAGPLGFIAIETGWMVTELGRQPWVIYGVMRTAQAVTPITGLVIPFVSFTVLYLLLSTVLVFLLRRIFLGGAADDGSGMPAATAETEARHAA